MNKYRKQLINWLLSLGKVKGSIIYFLLLSLFVAVFFLIFQSIDCFVNNKKILPTIIENSHYFLFYLFLIVLQSSGFYDRETEIIKKQDELYKKGLTPADLERISFIRNWETHRKAGVLKYTLYNGGLIAGMILVFPISAVRLLNVSGKLSVYFADISDMLIFIMSSTLLGYVSGVLIYTIRWFFNQNRFNKLTNVVI